MCNKTFVPKGGMCANCVNLKEDCTGIDFAKMHPIVVDGEFVYVACKQYKKA